MDFDNSWRKGASCRALICPELDVCNSKFHLFQMAMMAVPYRKDFLIALGKDASEKTILEHMQLALDEMAVNLDQIIAFYIEKGEDKEGKV